MAGASLFRRAATWWPKDSKVSALLGRAGQPRHFQGLQTGNPLASLPHFPLSVGLACCKVGPKVPGGGQRALSARAPHRHLLGCPTTTPRPQVSAWPLQAFGLCDSFPSCCTRRGLRASRQGMRPAGWWGRQLSRQDSPSLDAPAASFRAASGSPAAALLRAPSLRGHPIIVKAFWHRAPPRCGHRADGVQTL